LLTAGGANLHREGGLIGYGINVFVLFRRAATFVDKILKGAKPADIPFEQATRFETSVSSKTAKTLGINIPNTLLVRADEVVE
jgi:putative ABC transport system substrate-binding protein